MNRTVLLRGINVSGTSKQPTRPCGYTHRIAGFYDNPETVTFVGRPFPLSECPRHFRRLRCWGFNFIRLVVTWEALEHRGPGLYDYDYIKYITKVVNIAGEFGFGIYVDPHQDVWSRWTGGCGAPAWTMELVGFDIEAFPTTGAAVLHQTYQPSVDDFPLMLWPTNLYKLACATMFTLFWSGNDFAPNLKVGSGECRVEDLSCIKRHLAAQRSSPKTDAKTKVEAFARPDRPTNIQNYLQERYVATLSVLARALRGAQNVVGFGTMNEPHNGYHGRRDLARVWGQLLNGVFPTPLESFALAEGIPVTVRNFVPGCCAVVCGIATQSVKLNTSRRRAWLPGRGCVWKQHGVWSVDARGAPRLDKPDYFSNKKDWSAAYYVPFAKRVAKEIQSIEKRWFMFLELPPEGVAPDVKFPELKRGDVPNAVNATHWYDGFSLFANSLQLSWNVDVKSQWPVFGERRVRDMFARQVGEIVAESAERIGGGAPTLIGEFGIPFQTVGDHFKTGDFTAHARLLDSHFEAMERNKVHYTLWNYTPDNTNKYGDQWNFEDLSLYSQDQTIRGASEPKRMFRLQESRKSQLVSIFTQQEGGEYHESFLYSGGRALGAVARPFAMATCGTIVSSGFNMATKVYCLRFDHSQYTPPADGDESAVVTEVFIPMFQYSESFGIEVTDGTFEVVPHKDHFCVLRYRHSEAQYVHEIRVFNAASGARRRPAGQSPALHSAATRLCCCCRSLLCPDGELRVDARCIIVTLVLAAALVVVILALAGALS